VFLKEHFYKSQLCSFRNILSVRRVQPGINNRWP